MKRIVEGAWLIPMGTANAVLLDGGGELAMIDAGWGGKVDAVLDAIRRLGRSPADLRHLLFTHHHYDHIGSAAAIVRATGATTYMHPIDIPIAESGGPFRPMRPAPGLLQQIVYRLVWRAGTRVEPVAIDRSLADGEELPIAGGLKVVHVPGHCAGQVAFLWRGGRLLIGGDVGITILGLCDPLGFEDADAGRWSQRRIASLDFEAAVFGHGPPIRSRASARVRMRWG